ncbi:hypothetical protein F4810DRAFT_115806 [Camillea tinctor]|nr:hypothetical protein F4810DRAFT_115806 [Camillea tinctor]
MSCLQGDYKPCGQGLPGNFCCESGHTCIALASSTTALCCPGGSNCSVIQPIPCDIQLQNVTAFPESEVFTTNLSRSLPACGNGACCPFGFLCNGDKCVIGTANTTNATISATTASSSAPLSTLSSRSLHTTSPVISRTSSSSSFTTSLTGTIEPTPTSVVQAITQSASPTTPDIPATSTSLSDHELTTSPKTIGIGVGVTIGVCLFVAAMLLLYRRCIKKKRRQSNNSSSVPLLWDPFPFSPRGRPSPNSSWGVLRHQSASSSERYSMIQKQTPSLPKELSRLPPWRPPNLQLLPELSAHAVRDVPGAIELPATPLSFSFWNSSNQRTLSSRSTPHNPNYSLPKYGWPT